MSDLLYHVEPGGSSRSVISMDRCRQAWPPTVVESEKKKNDDKFIYYYKLLLLFIKLMI